MTTVVFVHGTGTREPSFSETFHLIQRSLHAIRQDIKVVACFWGDPLGTKLNANGASIPLYDSTRGPEQVDDEMYQIVLWEQLYQDPFYELRMLSTIPVKTVGFTPGQATLGEELNERVRNLKISSLLLQDKLKEAGIVQFFDEAKRNVIHSRPYIDALKTITETSYMNPYRAAIARAIVAEAMMKCSRQQQYTFLLTNAFLRDEVIQLLSKELGEDEQSRSIGTWVGKQLFGLAIALGAMDQVQRKRGAITDATYPAAGDILLYQGRGDELRAFIRQSVQQSEPPVVLLAHSLGGIACVDLLIMEPLPQVHQLITVGSQAPFFYEINALHSLLYGQPLPAYFPPWLNIYDLRDFLSYVGAGVFHEKVQDTLVDSKQPFPQSHGAYWTNPATWKAIEERLPK